LHRNGWSGATGCTGGRVSSFLPWYLPIHMRCVTQHHRISSDPTQYLHAPHVERRCEACLSGLNWVVCLVELRGVIRVSHNIQRAVATSQLYSSDASVVVCDGPQCVYSTTQHLHASRMLESRAGGHDATYRYTCCDAAYFISAIRTDPLALQSLSNSELPGAPLSREGFTVLFTTRRVD
jgi:hypothetical protein